MYHYHLSDDMKHDFAFTSIVAHSILDKNNLPKIIRRKSDNCATQYKSCNVFGEYQKIAKINDRKVIIYFGASGHGKGLVDAMSAFGVKGPLSKAVLTVERFKYKSSEDIFTYLRTLFKDDKQKKYYNIEATDIATVRRDDCSPLSIPGCMNYHMICFNTDGSLLTKNNICSCDDCLQGNFLNCDTETGTLILGDKMGDEDNVDSDVEYEDDDEFGDEIEEDLEQYELRSSSVLVVIQKGSVIALFSPENAIELFYLCKVIDYGVATDELSDTNNHHIGRGTPYILVNYFEKKMSKFSKNSSIMYKLLSEEVYVLPTQVMLPSVNASFIGSNLHLTVDEYQWLSDSI